MNALVEDRLTVESLDAEIKRTAAMLSRAIERGPTVPGSAIWNEIVGATKDRLTRLALLKMFRRTLVGAPVVGLDLWTHGDEVTLAVVESQRSIRGDVA